MLNGPGGLVSGSTSLGVNNQVVVFTPDTDLQPNASYTTTASGFRDLAGNAALDQPYTATFATLDTIGPSIAEIRLKDGAAPVANSAVELEVVLAIPEAGARVRMTADFVPIGETTEPGDLDLPFTLPAEGGVTIRATAIDPFGNEGPFAETVFEVLGNQPPRITVTQVLPASGPLPTGGAFQLRAEATDDAGVVNFRAAVTGAAEIALQSNNDGSAIF
ncbi:MAG: Ig-like domain-containing protein, partial [Akkermansiaceae bacterium]|nr:Ig-like domain-containing protein [Akkermansiaceae bacterium]